MSTFGPSPLATVIDVISMQQEMEKQLMASFRQGINDILRIGSVDFGAAEWRVRKPMTEADWLTSNNPAAMLTHLRPSGLSGTASRVSDRKLRLFACACCRAVWHLLTDPRSRHAVEVAERYVDGAATDKERADADEETSASDPPRFVGITTCESLAANAAYDTSWNCRLLIHGVGDARDNDQATLLRHIIGNPFRLPHSVQWYARIKVIAQAIYDGEQHLVGPLSDMLRDDGFEGVADHLRSEAWHPKGCWCLDTILNRS